MTVFQSLKLNLTWCLLLSFMLLFSCEKEEATPTPVKEEVPQTATFRSAPGHTYAVSLYRPGVPAEIYEIDVFTGDWTGTMVQVSVNGIFIENVTGITRIQPLANPPHPEDFYVVSLGDNSHIPGLSSQYSSNVWEIDITTGEIIGLFKTLQNPVTDLCAADFFRSYWVKGGCAYTNGQPYDCYYTTGFGMVSMEESPQMHNGQLTHHLVYFDSYDNFAPFTANFNPVRVPIGSLPVNEEVHGLTWVRDITSGCPVLPGMQDALEWTDHWGVVRSGDVALVLVTYDPATQEYKEYTLKFDQTTLNNLSIDAVPSPNNPILATPPPALSTHFSLGWITDAVNGQGMANMLTGGNLQSFPNPNSFYEFFDNCNPMMQNGQPTPNSIPVEIADFISAPYPF